MSGLQVVIPSASALPVLRQTLPTVRRALREVGIAPDCVVFVDDRPGRAGVGELVARLGFERVETGGVGLASARNRGATVRASRWVSFVDDDIELDPGAYVAAFDAAEPSTALVGGLRPPEGAPDWLVATYENATMTPASGLAPEGYLPPVSFGGGLSLLPRWMFDATGGFPPYETWGAEDAMFGLRLVRVVGPDLRLRRLASFSGVHLYLPTWEQWLERRYTTGQRLAHICRQLDAEQAAQLQHAYGRRGTTRVLAKSALAAVPHSVWRYARGRLIRRAAGTAVEARGFRDARASGDET